MQGMYQAGAIDTLGLGGKEDSDQKYRQEERKTTRIVHHRAGKWKVTVIVHLIYAGCTYIHFQI